MLVGDRLRAVREAKKLSQGDIERATGLLRCYVSRVENGHTVPSIETLEKMAGALGLKLYELLYDGEKPPQLRTGNPPALDEWGGRGKEARYLWRLKRSLALMSEADRTLLMFTLERMVSTRKR